MKLNAPEFFGQFTGKLGAKIAVKQDGGEIEAITSATITSRAVCKAIADAAEKVTAAKTAAVR
jgi:electron transport complex protein RnfG